MREAYSVNWVMPTRLRPKEKEGDDKHPEDYAAYDRRGLRLDAAALQEGDYADVGSPFVEAEEYQQPFR